MDENFNKKWHEEEKIECLNNKSDAIKNISTNNTMRLQQVEADLKKAGHNLRKDFNSFSITKLQNELNAIKKDKAVLRNELNFMKTDIQELLKIAKGLGNDFAIDQNMQKLINSGWVNGELFRTRFQDIGEGIVHIKKESAKIDFI